MQRLKTGGFQYATGAAYCISHTLMTKARKYFEYVISIYIVAYYTVQCKKVNMVHAELRKVFSYVCRSIERSFQRFLEISWIIGHTIKPIN